MIELNIVIDNFTLEATADDDATISTPPTSTGPGTINFISVIPPIPLSANSSTANTGSLEANEVQVPSKREVMNELSDWVATGGEMLKIYTWEELEEKYEEEGGEIPGSVKSRAQERGIQPKPITATSAGSSQTQYSNETVSAAGTSDEFHTGLA